MFLVGPNRAAVALVVAIAATCYVAAAVFARPWMAWAWIPIAFVVVVAGKLVELEPLVATGVAAAALVVVGSRAFHHPPRGDARDRGPARSTARFAVAALLLAPAVGLVVVALTLVAHGIWDVWHLRRHRDLVSPSLAEACIALDVPARAGRPRRRARLSGVGPGRVMCSPSSQVRG